MRIWPFGIVLSLLSGCAATDRESGEAGNWVSLFNGRDLTGWVVKCKPADVSRPFWTVDDGTIVADSMGHEGHDYVWLATDREYGDFVLRLKFQPYRDSPGNSGVQIRSRYDDVAGWLDGPQIDIHPPGPWRTGMIWDETRGVQRWLWPDVPKGQWVDESMAVPGRVFRYADDPAGTRTSASASAGAPNNGWNDLEITAVGTKLSATLNGLRIMDYDGQGVLDDAIHREHNVGQRGVIALQIHKGDQLRIRFKDIRIRTM